MSHLINIAEPPTAEDDRPKKQGRGIGKRSILKNYCYHFDYTTIITNNKL
jgi:hypothetical protein